MRSMGAEKEAAYRGACVRPSFELPHVSERWIAVNAAVAVAAMEECSDFNAGHGSCLTTAGEVVDAAVMNGADQGYGAVAAVPGLGNAVRPADVVRESQHIVFLRVQPLSPGQQNRLISSGT